MNDPVAYRAEEHKLQDGLALVEGDPFLESFFGEWAAQYHSEGNYQENIRALQRALAKGYPTANLYYKLGNFLWLDHRIPEARRAYSLAARCRPNYTNVQAALDYLQKLPEGEGKKALDTP
jgi:tetratricopeptide (TPR) repeat protein